MVKPKIKLLLDENIGLLVETSLHRAGLDVISVIRTMRGADDVAVIKKAQKENRIVVTLDRDFGYLVHQAFHQHTGVVYLRLKDESPKNVIKVLKKSTRQFPEMINKFSKITEDRIIIRSGTLKWGMLALGLYLAKQIVMEHHGDIEVTSPGLEEFESEEKVSVKIKAD